MPDDNPESGKEFRQKFENLLKDHKKLQEDYTGLQRKMVFTDAGVGHLSDRRKNMILASFEDPSKITADEVKAIAEEEGWMTQTPPPPENQNGQQNGQGGTQQNGQSQQTGGQSEEDPNRELVIEGLTAQETAHIMSMREDKGGSDLDDLFSKSDSKEGDLAAIRRAGAMQGLILDSDLD